MKSLIENKNGFATEIFGLIFIAIVMVLFFAGWLYANRLVEGVLTSGDLDNSQVNVTEAVEATYSHYVDGLAQLKIIAVFIFLGFFVGTLITAYFSRQNIFLLFVYVLASFLITILSFYVSNQYENILLNPTIGPTLNEFSMLNIILEYLPYWIIVTSMLGIILSVMSYRANQGGAI